MPRPSGDQDGSQSSAELLVRRVTPEPSWFIAYISPFPSLLDENAIRRPSGDQEGSQSPVELSVRRATPEPSWFIEYISQFPSLLDANAMRPSSAVEAEVEVGVSPGWGVAAGVGVCAETGDATAPKAIATTAAASAARCILTGLFPLIQLSVTMFSLAVCAPVSDL